MKRSRINTLIDEAENFFADRGFLLPDFAFWTPDEWRRNKKSCDELIECGLGWDVTDFGSDDFERCGLLLFTLRNGIAGSVKYPKPYAEKIMRVKPGQVTPMHCHHRKQEDIINRGGGLLVFRLCPDAGGTPGKGEVCVVRDGRTVVTDSESELRLEPGSSLTLVPGAFHAFWADPAGGAVMTGEVSSVNDDNADNCFAEKRERFPGWEEDTSPVRLTVSDYKKML